MIPGGTGNLLAGNLRIPASPERAARALVSGKPKPFDLGRMDRPGGAQYFAVACGAGYDARVMAGTLSEHKRRWGMAAYVATTLRLITDIRSTITSSRSTAWSTTRRRPWSWSPTAARSSPRSSGSGRASAPTTACSTWSSCGPTASARASGPSGTCSGTPRTAEGQETFVGYARGREIRVETNPVQPVQLDGEPGGETPFTATVVPGAIRIMVP